MKKHIFAFICIFMLLFNTFAYTPTKAMDIGVAIDVGSDILYQSWDMLQSLINGFTIGLSQYSGYADKAAAMGAYYDDWGDVLTVLTQGYLSPAEVEQPAISLNTVYPLDFGMDNAVMRDFIYQYGGFVEDPTQPMYAYINHKAIASWNRYQDGWIKRYLNAFESANEQIQVNPDPMYNTFLAYINNRDSTNYNSFWFYDYPQTIANPYSASQQVQIVTYPFTNYTIIMPNNSNVANPFNPTNNNGNWYGYAQLHHIASLYINSNVNGTYNLSFSSDPITNSVLLKPNNEYYSWFNIKTDMGVKNYGVSSAASSTYNVNLVNQSLDNIFAFILAHFKNVNIFVDGECWTYVGVQTDPLVSAPDVIRNETGDIIGNDVLFPTQDLRADLVKFVELIDDKIMSGDDITIDDVIDAGIITDANGNILTDENRDEYLIKKSVSTVIADALADDPTAGFVPDAPLPPDEDPWNWNFPTIVIPEGGDSDPRSTGLSVLARIVNITNQGLPAELITMFWGIAITLLILGIIKILHK